MRLEATEGIAGSQPVRSGVIPARGGLVAGNPVKGIRSRERPSLFPVVYCGT
jgi:hypothetical protein